MERRAPLAAAEGDVAEVPRIHIASGTPEHTGLDLVGLAVAILLVPGIVIYLSFNAGGFFPVAPGIATIVAAQALLVRTITAKDPFAGFDWRLGIPLVALASLGAWELASALWSHAPARAIDDFDRTLLYLLLFAFFGSFASDAARVRWLVRGLAAGITVVCLLALLSRVLPHVWPTRLSYASNRLNYPLTYWNAEGLLAAIGLILGFHLTCDGEEPPVVRVIAAAAVPVLAATLLFTFSRGAVGAAAIGLVAYTLIARPSAIVGGLLATAATTAIAVHAAYDATLLAGSNLTSAGAYAEGRHVAFVVGVCVLASAGLRVGLLEIDRALGRVAGSPAARRMPSWAISVAATLVVLIVAVALGGVGYVSREYSGFVRGVAPAGTLTRDRLYAPFNDGRLPLWKVAVDAYRAEPLRGQGAGTFQTYFLAHRPGAYTVIDAHSLYLQTLAELGIVGLVLLLIVLLGILVLLAARIRGRERAVYGALFAAGLAWAVHNGFDWDWQMPAVTAWIFAAGGLALGRRNPAAAERVRTLGRWRPVLAAGWLALAITPFLAVVSYSRLQAAEFAVGLQNCSAAKQDSLSSLSYLGVRPEPYAIIGMCDLEQGYATASVSALRKAEAYDPTYWQYHYMLALALAGRGINPRSQLEVALRLDPLESLTQDTLHALRRTDRRQWLRLAPGLARKALESGELSI